MSDGKSESPFCGRKRKTSLTDEIKVGVDLSMFSAAKCQTPAVQRQNCWHKKLSFKTLCTNKSSCFKWNDSEFGTQN